MIYGRIYCYEYKILIKDQDQFFFKSEGNLYSYYYFGSLNGLVGLTFIDFFIIIGRGDYSFY